MVVDPVAVGGETVQTFDVIVVGAGGMGTAAAWQLARHAAFPPVSVA
jgi:glycine/D-amino acid oxidase-like deaminating enzyme